MMSEQSKSGKQNPEASRKWALARHIGGAMVAAGLAGVGIGGALAYNEKVVPSVLEVVTPDMEISPSDPLMTSLVDAEPNRPDAPVINEFALFSDEQTASIGVRPMPTDLPIG